MQRIIQRVLSGSSDRNLRFDDVRQLRVDFGFSEPVRGDHHIFSRSAIVEIINLQPQSGGMAKPYQVRQVRELILRYHLHRHGEELNEE